MEIVKKLNPFKRFHHQSSTTPASTLFDSTGELVLAAHPGGHATQNQQSSTQSAALQRLMRSRRGDSERKRDARAAATEKELLHLNQKIEKLLANIDENTKSDETFADDEECVVCLSAKATMRTMPCGHRVVCRKCFVKTIQTAVAERCLPLRCVVCRTKILKLKQQQPLQSQLLQHHVTSSSMHHHPHHHHQQQQQQPPPLLSHQHSSHKLQQQQHHSSHKSSSSSASAAARSTTTASAAAAAAAASGGAKYHHQLQPARGSQVTGSHGQNGARSSSNGPIPKKSVSPPGASSHQPATSGPAGGKSSSSSGPGGLHLLSAAFGLCGRQTPPVGHQATSAAAGGHSGIGSAPTSGRMSRPMQPLLIYPADVSVPGGGSAVGPSTAASERGPWPRRSAIGWSEDGDVAGNQSGVVVGGSSHWSDDRGLVTSGYTASPVVVLSSNTRRVKHAAAVSAN